MASNSESDDGFQLVDEAVDEAGYLIYTGHNANAAVNNANTTKNNANATANNATIRLTDANNAGRNANDVGDNADATVYNAIDLGDNADATVNNANIPFEIDVDHFGKVEPSSKNHAQYAKPVKLPKRPVIDDASDLQLQTMASAATPSTPLTSAASSTPAASAAPSTPAASAAPASNTTNAAFNRRNSRKRSNISSPLSVSPLCDIAYLYSGYFNFFKISKFSINHIFCELKIILHFRFLIFRC